MRVANGKVEKPGSQNGTFMLSNRDLGDGEVDFPHLMRALKRVAYKGWIVVDDHYTPLGPRQDFARSRKYIQEVLSPIYS